MGWDMFPCSEGAAVAEAAGNGADENIPSELNILVMLA